MEKLGYPYNMAFSTFHLNTFAPECTVKTENGSVVVTIKNQQPYVLDNRILYSFYNIRYKNHFEENNWTYVYNYLPQFVVSYPGIPESKDALIPSDSQYTVLNYSINSFTYAQVDFQTEIVLYNLTYSVPSDGNPTPPPQSYKYEYTLADVSDWSAIQTLTIPGSSPSSSPTQQPTLPPLLDYTPTPSPTFAPPSSTIQPSPSPTPTPTSAVESVLVLIIVLAVVVVVTGVLVYLRRAKKQK